MLNRLFGRLGSSLLGLDHLDNRIHLLIRQKLELLALPQNGHLNVLATRLHNLAST